MRQTGILLRIVGVILTTLWAFGAQPRAEPAAHGSSLAKITIDYPLEGSVFPPEITAPTLIWRDAAEHATRWRIEVAFGDGSPNIQVESRGEPMRIGEIDERCIMATNELPKLTPEQAAAHTWTPDTGTWEAIKRHSSAAPAAVTITGFHENQSHDALSRGHVAIQTSKDPYPPDGKLAEYANDPKELQIQYDLFRIPFNGGQGGQPERIAGASGNGMSNTFPKVSPDGRWIVFVQCRNGQLMRPDSQLYIVPVEGGQARKMRCNTSLMNSWHSFSPNGRWLVFSSKSRGPYTKMYLTHLDEEGNDSPAILIENPTAANRAANLPEFVNIPPDGLLEISAPAVDIYKKFVHARDIMKKGQYEAAIPEWRELLQMNPDDYRIHNNIGLALAETRQFEEAIIEDEKALEIYPYAAETHCNLGLVLATKGRLEEARAEFEKAVKMNPTTPEAHYNLGVTLASQGQLDQAIPHFEKAVEINPSSAEAQYNFAIALASRGDLDQALQHFAKTVEINPALVDAHYNMGTILYMRARVQEALAQWREALRLNPNFALAMIQIAHALAASPNASDRNGAEAVKLAEQAVQLTGGRNPEYLDTLAAASAEAGRFPEAIDTARRALELAKQQNQQDLVEGLNARINLYEAQKPYRDDLTALSEQRK